MTIQQLLELAALDSLGLLDEFESTLFTRSFHDAPATVQDEIRRLQAEIVEDERLLPGEEPDPQLRQRVLEAVAQAIERDDRLAPLATIGYRWSRSRDRDQNRRFPLTASGHFWRAASFVLAGVAVVFALFWGQTHMYVKALTEYYFIDDTENVLEELIGPTVKSYLFDADTRHVALTPELEGSQAKGLILLNERTSQAFLVTDGLPQARSDAYTLILEDGQGRRKVHRLGSTGGVQGISLGTLHVTALAIARWQIVDATGAVILSNA